MTNKKLIVGQIRELSKGFKSFVFENGQELEYQSGQFLTLVQYNGTEEIRRSYSIVSSPALPEALTIAVKRIDNGFFSRKLVDHTRIGDELITTGAAGFFRLPENIKSFSNIFFFAAGSGIAPIFSLLKTVIHLYPEISIHLIYSNTSVHTTAFHLELTAMKNKFPDRLKVDFLFSEDPDLRRARLNRELLFEFLSIYQTDKLTTLFYTCGPETYMRMIIYLLVEEGVPKDHIKKEDFNPGNKKQVRSIPPDQSTHIVDLDVNGHRVNFPVQFPDTILQAAKKIKLELPYSCETGKCGSCAARCVSGQVWLSNNEVLTDKDLASGLTLTCTGYPQYGDVILKIE